MEVLLLKPEVKCLTEDYLKTTYGSNVDVPDKLRSMVWIFRSSLNKKTPLFEEESNAEEKEKLAGLWQQMKDFCDEYSQNYIRKRIY